MVKVKVKGKSPMMQLMKDMGVDMGEMMREMKAHPQEWAKQSKELLSNTNMEGLAQSIKQVVPMLKALQDSGINLPELMQDMGVDMKDLVQNTSPQDLAQESKSLLAGENLSEMVEMMTRLAPVYKAMKESFEEEEEEEEEESEVD